MAPKPKLHLVTAAPTPEGAAPAEPGEPAPEPALPPLTPDQQRRVKSALPMIERCAREIARTYHTCVAPEDLLGPGAIGAAEASRKYEQAEHRDFEAYARQYIRYRIFDSIRNEFTTLRARVEKAMERQFDGFTSHQIPGADSFSDAPETVVEAAREGQHEALAAAFFAAILETRGASPEEILMELDGRVETLKALDKAIGELLPLERDVIRLIYDETMFVDDVAKKVGVSPRSVQRRHASALRKLRMHLDFQGVTEQQLRGR